MTGPCWCGHPHDVHRHLRPGTDCSQCRCPEYLSRRSVTWLQVGFALLMLVLAAGVVAIGIL